MYISTGAYRLWPITRFRVVIIYLRELYSVLLIWRGNDSIVASSGTFQTGTWDRFMSTRTKNQLRLTTDITIAPDVLPYADKDSSQNNLVAPRIFEVWEAFN